MQKFHTDRTNNSLPTHRKPLQRWADEVAIPSDKEIVLKLTEMGAMDAGGKRDQKDDSDDTIKKSILEYVDFQRLAEFFFQAENGPANSTKL